LASAVLKSLRFVDYELTRHDLLFFGLLLVDVDHIDFKIHSIIEQQNASQASQVKPVSRESQERKAVILAQYAEISDGEEYPFYLTAPHRSFVFFLRVIFSRDSPFSLHSFLRTI